MRFVIFGAGAIGRVVGARLHEGGFEVALIARGPHLDALRRSGLTLSARHAQAGGCPSELSVGDELAVAV
jgi:ketopantoate reductase